MRVSLTARFVSHPSIDFGAGRHAPGRPRLGLPSGETVYHRPRRLRRTLATVHALRSQTSQFSFPAVGRLGRVRGRRQVSPLGPPRARRA
ncbi:MAG: hypothetical protein M3P14_12175 [Chloroflexota bacterium]|nr:hypothetical protein [Chloroflexota bacterium]